MSAKVKGFVVALDADLHADDAKRVADAIALVRGVSGVELVEADGLNDSIVRLRVNNEWRQRLAGLVHQSLGE